MGSGGDNFRVDAIFSAAFPPISNAAVDQVNYVAPEKHSGGLMMFLLDEQIGKALNNIGALRSGEHFNFSTLLLAL